MVRLHKSKNILSHIADSAATFSIPNSQFQNGPNIVNITVSHADCPHPGHLALEFLYQRPHSTTPPHPTTDPTVLNTFPTTRPTISLPTTHPTSPPTTSTPPPPPPPDCSISRQGLFIVLNCSSYTHIVQISYFINGIPVGSVG